MTPLFFLAALVPLASGFQNPNLPATPLDGVWGERAIPGEKFAENLVATFMGEEITLNLRDVVYRGTLRPDPDRGPTVFRFMITMTDGKKEYPEKTYFGQCMLMGDQLFLQVFPHVVRMREGGGMDLHRAATTFKLERVKK